VGDTYVHNLEFGARGKGGIVKHFHPQTIPVDLFIPLKCMGADVMFSHQLKIYPENLIRCTGL